jgi:murein DD-endopeptidase MepM/ murein hydrolase activator NlpD
VGLRALVGIPATTVAGPARLGIEIHGRRGRRRLSAAFDVAPAPRAQRSLAIPAARIAAVTTPAALRDSRRLLATLRTTSEVAQWMGPLRPPVATAPAASFGVVEERAGGLSVNERLDGIYGEYHRGLDYPVPVGTVVQAPAAGTVLLAAFLSVSGHTLVIDHGQGLVSVLCHLSRIEVAQGQWVEGRTPVALSGDTGVLATPHLHWGTYLHGIAVDPAIISSATF